MMRIGQLVRDAKCVNSLFSCVNGASRHSRYVNDMWDADLKSLFFAIDWQSRLRIFAILFFAGLFLAVIAPFGTEDTPIFERMIYWIGLAVGGSIIGEMIVCKVFATFEKLPDFVNLTLVSLLVAVPMTPVVALLGDWEIGMYLPISLWLELFVYVWTISLFLTLTMYAFSRILGIPHPATGAVDKGAPSRRDLDTLSPSPFLQRLPIKYHSAELFAVSAEDHYLRVHTSIGEELLLMRLADAVKELQETSGLQTHRSWWVAKRGIESSERKNGQVRLHLKSGAVAPVSRTYLPAVRDAGWI